ncbi:HopJ type III effector protein [Paraferrimonas sp. SM1919]|uniref:HopJ type III effector protein n=1 Tax=Paraferrimonas sp. SM1919 TaxID=2662263 RepID=UPI0013CFD444|nr:HopJ type III effector protein [Paraferrimonas sp. SM1919]
MAHAIPMAELIQRLQQNQTLSFKQVIETIDHYYDYQQTDFQNGSILNRAGDNEGSCKVFAFASLHQLDKQATLNCFAEHYQQVLQNPEGECHQNIRQFINHGWQQISFKDAPLSLRENEC